ncbi:pleckstrin homology domain-containing family J member 1 isoform X1 [Mustela nigripes]|uniref:pleckstrin homology domain-containing family J member 1 isoform X1 n=1 Tax=Mustela nigripes TaxID=77151 RepID=UPI002815AB4D|nr:pleckstrin homology domain-containing family J member 1 isoform X1 [Mustela nigripes]
MRYNEKELQALSRQPAELAAELGMRGPKKGSVLKRRLVKLVVNFLFYFRTDEAEPVGALLLERCRVTQEEPSGFSISECPALPCTSRAPPRCPSAWSEVHCLRRPEGGPGSSPGAQPLSSCSRSSARTVALAGESCTVRGPAEDPPGVVLRAAESADFLASWRTPRGSITSPAAARHSVRSGWELCGEPATSSCGGASYSTETRSRR